MIQVRCHLKDCMYWHEDPMSSSLCQCSHPDKEAYMNVIRCPLYRLDWSKQAERVMAIQSKLRNGK